MKRIYAVILILSISFGTLDCVDARASKTDRESDVNILVMEKADDLYENYDVLDNVDVIQTDAQVIEKTDVELVKEVLDNGTDIIVTDTDVEVMEELFDASAPVDDGTTPVLACYISSENASYSITPVYATVLYDASEKVSNSSCHKDKEELHKDICKNKGQKHLQVNIEELYEVKNDNSQEQFLLQMTEDDKVALQTSTLVGESFTESNKLVYFYKEGAPIGVGTDYVYSTNSSKSGWSKMGTLNMKVFGIRVRTNDKTTFDNVYSVIAATGNNDKSVKQFTVNISVPQLATNVIMNETTSTGSSYAVTGKLATSVSASGAISQYTTYSYNTGAQAVVTDFGDKYEKSWTFSPRTFDENGTYRVRPGILLKKTDGKASAVTGVVSVSSFQVSGGIRTYTIKDTVKCSIKFKNHSQV